MLFHSYAFVFGFLPVVAAGFFLLARAGREVALAWLAAASLFFYGWWNAALVGLLPVLWSDGTGADVMKRVAAPMVGGLATSFLMELLVYPAIYLLWKWNTEVKRGATEAGA